MKKVRFNTFCTFCFANVNKRVCKKDVPNVPIYSSAVLQYLVDQGASANWVPKVLKLFKFTSMNIILFENFKTLKNKDEQH